MAMRWTRALSFLSKRDETVTRAAGPAVRFVDLGRVEGRVYAIGDVHGRVDLLQDALAAIRSETASLGGRPTVILLGDLIDRGSHSANVLDLITEVHADMDIHAVLGNHERMMLSFASDPHATWRWLETGGFETLLSYGISMPPNDRLPARRIGQILAAHIPDGHFAYLRNMPHGVLLEHDGHGYLFCHAGLDPTRRLDQQIEAAVLWGKGTGPYDGLCTVQGHVVVKSPQLSDTCMRIDTGAWASGILTVLRLERGCKPATLAIGGKLR